MHCRRVTIAVILSLAGAGCASHQHEAGPEPAAEPTAEPAAEPAAGTAPAPASPGEPPPVKDIVLVTDRHALAELAAAGADLGSILHGQPARDNRELATQPAYAAMAAIIERDLRATDRADPDAGVGVRGNIHRLFDWGWLRSPDARYELIGLVHRIDLAAVRPRECGEIHLIYRMAYSKEMSGERVSSRLPMTLAVILPGLPRGQIASPGGGASPGDASCVQAAMAWRAPAGLEGAALGAWLVSEQGPLDRALLAADRVELVRANLQSVRWPSAVRPDLGGHAEYTMYSFAPAPGGKGMIAGPLENTPDVARMRRSGALRAELLAWIEQNLDGIAAGTARMPDRFLARAAVSVTPRGLSRRANRPFRQILAPRDLHGLATRLDGRALIGSPQALLRRLDDLTCAGCHQSRTIAGFHLLGEDGDDVAPGNALAVSMSAHLTDEIERRAGIARALAAATPPDYTRPFAERGPGDPGALGARCALSGAPASGSGAVDPGFRDWTCAPGLVCAPYDAPGDDAVVGTCLPAGEMDVGGPCEFGPIKPHADSHRDRARNRAAATCADGAVCNINRTGFPGGMCTSSCADLPGTGTCGVIAVLEPFNACLARKTPFPRCLAEHVRPAGLRACDARTPCRDDYICARVPGSQGQGRSGHRGACMPPYFLFQMRVDGHLR
jgi:hypothetical protein